VHDETNARSVYEGRYAPPREEARLQDFGEGSSRKPRGEDVAGVDRVDDRNDYVAPRVVIEFDVHA